MVISPQFVVLARSKVLMLCFYFSQFVMQGNILVQHASTVVVVSALVVSVVAVSAVVSVPIQTR